MDNRMRAVYVFLLVFILGVSATAVRAVQGQVTVEKNVELSVDEDHVGEYDTKLNMANESAGNYSNYELTWDPFKDDINSKGVVSSTPYPPHLSNVSFLGLSESDWLHVGTPVSFTYNQIMQGTSESWWRSPFALNQSEADAVDYRLRIFRISQTSGIELSSTGSGIDIGSRVYPTKVYDSQTIDSSNQLLRHHSVDIPDELTNRSISYGFLYHYVTAPIYADEDYLPIFSIKGVDSPAQMYFNPNDVGSNEYDKTHLSWNSETDIKNSNCDVGVLHTYGQSDHTAGMSLSGSGSYVGEPIRFLEYEADTYDRVEISNSPELSGFDSYLEVELSAYINDLTYHQGLVCHYDWENNDRSYQLMIWDGDFRLSLSDDGENYTRYWFGSAPTGRFVNIRFRWDSGEVPQLWVDGYERSETSGATTTYSSLYQASSHMRLGQDITDVEGRSLDGRLRNVRIEGDGATVADYPINETSGDTIYDYSGNNNHGTVYGATWDEAQNYEIRWRKNFTELNDDFTSGDWITTNFPFVYSDKRNINISYTMRFYDEINNLIGDYNNVSAHSNFYLHAVNYSEVSDILGTIPVDDIDEIELEVSIVEDFKPEEFKFFLWDRNNNFTTEYEYSHTSIYRETEWLQDVGYQIWHSIQITQGEWKRIEPVDMYAYKELKIVRDEGTNWKTKIKTAIVGVGSFIWQRFGESPPVKVMRDWLQSAGRWIKDSAIAVGETFFAFGQWLWEGVEWVVEKVQYYGKALINLLVLGISIGSYLVFQAVTIKLSLGMVVLVKEGIDPMFAYYSEFMDEIIGLSESAKSMIPVV